MTQKKTNRNSVSSSEVYAGGALTQISVSDLKGNEVAINQLLNRHNILQQELIDLRNKNQLTEEELTITKLSPLVACISAIVNVIGSVLLAVGASINSNDLKWLFYIMISAGAICLLVANIATVFYKSISKWLTKD